jgi:hypothetical protein
MLVIFLSQLYQSSRVLNGPVHLCFSSKKDLSNLAFDPNYALFRVTEGMSINTSCQCHCHIAKAGSPFKDLRQ